METSNPAAAAPVPGVLPEITTPPTARLVSLDAFRGLIMCAMASNGLLLAQVAKHKPDSPLWQLVGYHTSHAAWTGGGFWDMVQPAFMFMVGVAMAYSLASRQARGQSYGRMALHAAVRSLVLIALGIFFRSRHVTYTNFTFEDVLTQIGLGYFFLFLTWNRPRWLQLTIALAILLGYWLLFALYPLPSEGFDYPSVGVPADWTHPTGFAAHWNKNTNPAAAFDVWFLNLFPRQTAFAFNAGGYLTLNFIPSLATMIFGLLAGELLRSSCSGGQKLAWLCGAAAVAIAAGWGLDALGICPIVKRIWTPSWALYSTGWVMLMLAALYALVDLAGYRRWTLPLVVVGMNSLVMYAMAELIYDWIAGRARTHLGGSIFTLWGAVPAIYEPVLMATFVLIIMWLICYWLYRHKVFVRI